MANSTDRFYQVELSGRPAFWGDLGEQLTIAGVVLQGATKPIILMTPESPDMRLADADVYVPNVDEWSRFIRCSDDPQIFLLDTTGGVKAVHRKLRYAISGAIQQKVWVRDGLKCMYCAKPMGEVQLTIDHFVPLELGGANQPNNYLSACRKCNKSKGNKVPQDWCYAQGVDYQRLKAYLATTGNKL